MRFKDLMRPLSRFSRPEPPAPSPPSLQDRVASLDSGSQEDIAAAIVSDGEDELRAAAVRRLQDGDLLRKLAGLSDGAAPSVPASLKRIARERVAQLVDAGSIEFGALRAGPANTAALLSVAALCGDAAHLTRMLASIEDPQWSAKLVLEGSSSRIRQLAAERIEDPAELNRLLKQVRGRDKNVYKIIKHKCDALRAVEQRVAQIESDASALCASLERHSRRVHDPLYEPQFRHFETRWQALDAKAAPDTRDRALAAISRCREVIAAHSRQLAEKAAQESDHAARRTARAAAMAQAEAEARHRDEAAAVAAAEAAKVREAEEKARADKSAAEAQVLRQIGGLLTKAHVALRDGDTGRAAGLRRALADKLPAAPAVPGYLASQMQQLDTKLDELKEWKDYAVAPKRAALIEEMEGLIGAEEEPTILAARIKQLQEDWKTISKGIASDSGTDWDRFHRAAQTAYQPCRIYFEEQARLRLQNVEQRRAVVERLLAFEKSQDVEHPDWRAVATVLREAPREWRRHSPVDRVAGRAVQEEFDASMGRLQGRLEAWHAHNRAEKQSLIQRAHGLLSMADGREATESIKRLQLLWKEVGPAERDQDGRLWEEFRAQCDAIFQKRQQAFAEYTAGLETHKAQAVALCEEAERGGALSGAALIEAAGAIPRWRAAFEALGELPRGDERRLHDRFSRALDLCQARLSQQRARDQQASFTHLLKAAQHIQNYGWAVSSGAASSDGDALNGDALKEAARVFIAGIAQLPKGGAAALKDAWLKADAAATEAAAAEPVAIDTAAREAALRMLCIRSEIITERPTPPEDQALRREYQVQRLMQRMGQHNAAAPDELDALALEWVRVGPVSPPLHETLLARFMRCRPADDPG